MTERPETLYHYTHELWLSEIYRDGIINTTESNIGFPETHFGPDVVWALDTDWMPDGADLPHGLLPQKTLARIAFKTPKRAYKWTDWSWVEKMKPDWKETMIRTGGGQEAADHWWVVDHPIISRHWTAIELFDKGKWVAGNL
jgi:hypothetical protein